MDWRICVGESAHSGWSKIYSTQSLLHEPSLAYSKSFKWQLLDGPNKFAHLTVILDSSMSFKVLPYLVKELWIIYLHLEESQICLSGLWFERTFGYRRKLYSHPPMGNYLDDSCWIIRLGKLCWSEDSVTVEWVKSLASCEDSSYFRKYLHHRDDWSQALASGEIKSRESFPH